MNVISEIKKNKTISDTYVNIDGEKVEGLIVSDEIISGAKYNNSTFKDILFINCDFQGTEITSCEFIDCEFLNCNFNFVKVKNCNFITSKVENCYFCITNSLNCNFQSCSYIQNTRELSQEEACTFTNCFIDEAGIVPKFNEFIYAMSA